MHAAQAVPVCLHCAAHQAPLQPLQDNLESQTYETFEKDVTKYACYQAAVAAALQDRVPDSQVEFVVTTLMVVGAGGCVCGLMMVLARGRGSVLVLTTREGGGTAGQSA
jgi:hypothetical protein